MRELLVTRLDVGAGRVSHWLVLISGSSDAMVRVAVDDVLRVLSDPLRARIVELLAAGPACTCHLVEDTGAKQPNVSGHLRILRDAGLVVPEPRGRYTYYRLLPDALEGTAGYLRDLAEQARDSGESWRECP